MNSPTLGELALQARFLTGGQLDDALRYQRQNYLEGDFRRLGELLVDYARVSRGSIRELLLRQGITIVECTLCETRYNALEFKDSGVCLRCGRRLVASSEDAPLTVEDAISGGGANADSLLIEYRQRNPRIGRYEILGEVGRGGMGVIYKANDTQLQRRVALKFLRPYEGATAEDKERFRREAQSIAQLSHANIVSAHAIEEAQGLSYMAMDFVQGVPMDILFNQGALSPDEIVRIGAQVARGLHCAHNAGILHRDVKPANIVIDRKVKPYLVDFGIAKRVKDESMSLTTEGEVLGSLAYMAPEYVAQGKKVLDRRCDVYGVGVVLYEAISRGKLPYGDPDDDMMIMRLVKEQPAPVEKACPGIDKKLAKIINRAISKDRTIRHDSAEELAEELERWLEGGSDSGSDIAALIETGEVGDVFSRTGEDFVPLQVRGVSQRPPSQRFTALVFVQAALVVLLGLGWGVTVFLTSERTATWRLRAGQAELRAARALEKSGLFDEARASYDKAIEYLPEDPEPLRGRAALLERAGDAVGAARDTKAAASLDGGAR